MSPKVVPINTAITARMLPLYDAQNDLVRYVDEGEGRELLKAGLVEPLWSKKRIRALRLREELAAVEETPYGSTHDRPLPYSHDSETEDNPHGCWTLRHLPRSTRGIFRRVIEELAA